MGVWFDKLLELEPQWLFRLDEAVAATTFTGTVVDTHVGTKTGTVASGEPSLSAQETGTSVRMQGATTGSIATIAQVPEVNGNTWSGSGRSFSFRFKPNTITSQLLISDTSTNPTYYVRMTATGGLEFMHRTMTPAFSYTARVLTIEAGSSFPNFTALVAGQEYDIAVLLDWLDSPDAMWMRVYVDGEKVGEVMHTGYPVLDETGSGTTTHKIGGTRSGATTFDGWMQGYAAYEKALTTTQIRQIHQLAETGVIEEPTGPTVEWFDGASRQPATLLGWWDGSAIQPATLQGYWDGSAVVPL